MTSVYFKADSKALSYNLGCLSQFLNPFLDVIESGNDSLHQFLSSIHCNVVH